MSVSLLACGWSVNKSRSRSRLPRRSQACSKRCGGYGTGSIRYPIAPILALGNNIDTAPAATFDVADPAISVSSPLWDDQGGTTIPFELGSDATASTKALVLHLQGATGARAETITVSGTHSPVPPHKRQPSGTWHPHSGHPSSTGVEH